MRFSFLNFIFFLQDILPYLSFLYLYLLKLKDISTIIYHEIKNLVLSKSFTFYANLLDRLDRFNKYLEVQNKMQFEIRNHSIIVKFPKYEFVTSFITIKGLYTCNILVDDQPFQCLSFYGNEAIKNGFPSKRNTYIVGFPTTFYTINVKKVEIITTSVISGEQKSHMFYNSIPDEIIL